MVDEYVFTAEDIEFMNHIHKNWDIWTEGTSWDTDNGDIDPVDF